MARLDEFQRKKLLREGGVGVSMNNAVSVANVETLIGSMEEFNKKARTKGFNVVDNSVFSAHDEVNRRVPMQKKASVRRVEADQVEDLYSATIYLKKYLQEIKPGISASKNKKDRYRYAVVCLKETEKILGGMFPKIIQSPPVLKCLGGWVIIPIFTLKRGRATHR